MSVHDDLAGWLPEKFDGSTELVSDDFPVFHLWQEFLREKYTHARARATK